MTRSVDPGFPRRMRQIRELRNLSLRELGARTHYSKSFLADLEHGTKAPLLETAQRIDDALTAGGELAGMVESDPEARNQAWEAAELLRRVETSDTATATIEALGRTADQLCREYGWRDAAQLRADALTWLREVVQLRRHAGLRQHRELLTTAGWLGLLVGCVEYDMGMRTAAEATRVATACLGEEAGDPRIVAWTWEMAAWFALTQGRFADVLKAASVGQAVAGDRSVSVQLVAQEAKARARLGDVDGVRAALDRGQAMLDRYEPGDPQNHFVIDPDKWEFYAMDAYRLAGQDDLAEHHANRVLAGGVAPGGLERSPMRMAEARLTLGVVAARRGELDRAVTLGLAAFAATRRSLPSLLMVAGELDVELWRRYPHERPVEEFRAALRMVTPALSAESSAT